MDLPALPHAAIFVDVENMAWDRELGTVDFDIARIVARVREHANPIVRRAYADWSKLRGFRDPLLRAGFDQVQTTYMNQSKNGLDMQMSIDALECALTQPSVRLFYLVTADSDFSPLARALRRHGRTVVGLGWRAKSNEIFRAHCDLYVDYEALPGPAKAEAAPRAAPPAEPPPEPKRPPPAPRGTPRQPQTPGPGALAAFSPLLARLVLDRGPGARLPGPQFGAALRRLEPGFDLGRLGFRTLTQLVAAHPLLRREPERGPRFSVLLPRQMALADLPGRRPPPEALEAALVQAGIGYRGRQQHHAVLEWLFEVYRAHEAGLARAEAIGLVHAAHPEVPFEAVMEVDDLAWHGRAFQVQQRAGDDPLAWQVRLDPKAVDYDDFRDLHDRELIGRALRAGIVPTPAAWAEVLDGDGSYVEGYAALLAELGFADDGSPPEEPPAAPEPAPAAPEPPAPEPPAAEPAERDDVTFGVAGWNEPPATVTADTPSMDPPGKL